jgi:hypothetical protein
MGNLSQAFSIQRLIVWIWRYLLPILLLGLAVHLMLPQLTAFERALEVIKSMILWAMMLAITAQIISYLGSGYLLQAIVSVVGQRLTVVNGALITAAASIFSLVAGGLLGSVAATYRWVRGSGVSAEGAILAGWLPILLNNCALIVAALAGLMHLLIVHELSTLQAISFGLILLLLSLVIGGMLWGAQHRAQLTTLIIWIATRWAKLRHQSYDPIKTEAAVGKLFRAWYMLHTGGWRGPALGAVLNVVFDMLTLYFLFIAAGHAISPGILLVGYGLPQLFGKMTFLPGGIGVVEGTMAAMYNGLGVPDAITVVVVFTYRFISFWLPTLLGFMFFPYLQRVSTSATH